MYQFFHNILSDKKGGTVFTCFGGWHFAYMALVFGTIILILLLFKNKDRKTKSRVADITATVAFCGYISDFFLMPIAYGEIVIENLPFHGCTATCVLCYLSHHTQFLAKYRQQFAVIGLASNLIYVFYPAGIGWHMVHPLSYRVISSFFFHGTMTAHGIFTLAFDGFELKWRKCYKELGIICGMVAWALLGNTVYNGAAEGYDNFFNWFFVVRDPFYMLPADIAPFIMPFVMIAVMFVAVLLIYSAYFGIKKIIKV